MPGQRLLAHRRVGAQGDQHREPAARPCRASCTAPTSSGSGQSRVRRGPARRRCDRRGRPRPAARGRTPRTCSSASTVVGPAEPHGRAGPRSRWSWLTAPSSSSIVDLPTRQRSPPAAPARAAHRGGSQDGGHDIRAAARPRTPTGCSRPNRAPGRSPAGSTHERARPADHLPARARPGPRGWPTTSPFADPVSLLVSPDHYVTRLLHASGVPLDALGVGRARAADRGRGRGRPGGRFCAHWPVFRGTPVRYWLESELHDIFGVTARPSAETADAIYDQVAERLATPAYRPRALLRALRHRGAGHHRRPVRRPRRPRPAARRPGVRAPGAADLPARPLPRAGRRRLAGAGRRAWARSPATDTGDYAGLRRRAGGRGAGTSSRTARSRPTTATPTSSRSTLDPAEAARIYAAARAGRGDRRRRPPRCAGTCWSRWPGCRSRTGW